MTIEELQEIQQLIRKEVTAILHTSGRVAKEFYSVSEVARTLGKSDYRVGEWCREGRIHCEKEEFSGRWRISHSELERLRNGGGLLPKPKTD